MDPAQFIGQEMRFAESKVTSQLLRALLELKLDLSEALAEEAKSKGLMEFPAVGRMLRLN